MKPFSSDKYDHDGYSAEYDLTEIPQFVKKVIIPITYYTGKILGKYKHFKNAPEPVKY